MWFIICIYSFTIRIKQREEGQKAYAINFDSKEAVEYIQSNYKKYDEVLGDLEYDVTSDLVKFRSEKKGLNCVSLDSYIYIYICVYRNM